MSHVVTFWVLLFVYMGLVAHFTDRRRRYALPGETPNNF